MSAVIVLAALGCLAQASTSGDRPTIPNDIKLKPVVVRVTDTPGSGNSKDHRISALIVGGEFTPPTNCTCSGPYGWSLKDLIEIHRVTKMPLTPYDCLCNHTQGYYIAEYFAPTIDGEDCRCPPLKGWKQEHFFHLQNVTNLEGNLHDCFCSGREGYSLQCLQPPSDTEEHCKCPISKGWTDIQLQSLTNSKQLQGEAHDCFCESKFGHNLRQKQQLGDEGSENVGQVQCISERPQPNEKNATVAEGVNKKYIKPE